MTTQPKIKSIVVARITVTHKSGKKFATEVHADASFHDFYRRFIYTSPRKKTPIANFNRNYLQNLPKAPKSLDAVLALIQSSYLATKDPIVSTKIVIYKRGLLKKMFNASPDQLGKGLPKFSNALLLGKAVNVRRLVKSDYVGISRRYRIRAKMFGWGDQPVHTTRKPRITSK